MRRGVGDLHVDERARFAGAARRNEVHQLVLACAARKHGRVLLRGAVDQHLLGAADTRLVAPESVALHHLDQLPHPLLGDFGWDERPVISAAGVPGRGENTNVYAASYAASSTTSSVRRKSSSVSPGKPTIRSVVTARSGSASRAAASFRRYRSAVYPRCMRASVRSLPAWSGRWRCSHTASHSAIAALVSGRGF